MKLEHLFALVYTIFGVILIFLTPPFQVPDEPHHLYRVYQLSEGRIIAEKRGNQTGGALPRSMVHTEQEVAEGIRFNPEVRQDGGAILAMLDYPLQPADTMFVNFPNTALYSPVPYIPQLVAVLGGRVLECSPLVMLYIGRMVNLAVAICLFSLALSWVPLWKKLFFLVGLMPMTVYQSASFSPDALTNATAFLLVAFILRLAFVANERVSRKRVFALFGLGIVLSLCKSVYFPLMLLYFLIPAHKLGTRRQYVFVGIMLFACAVVTSMLWTSAVESIFSPYMDRGFTNWDEARNFILANPLRYTGMMLQDLMQYGPRYVAQAIGYFGWTDTFPPKWFTVAYAVIILGVGLTCGNEGYQVTVYNKALISMVVLLCIVLIITSQFIIWSIPGSGVIGSSQGRYFICLIPPALALFANGRLTGYVREALLRNVAVWLAVGSLALSVVVIYLRYYGPA